jgi:rod shape-determining protein MreC
MTRIYRGGPGVGMPTFAPISSMFRRWENVRDYAILALLLLVSLSFLLAKDYQAYRAARALSLEVSGPVDALFAQTGRYSRALQENTALRAETVQLATEVARLRAARRENESLRALVGFRDTLETGILPARVVSKDIARQENSLRINVGSSDGVRPGMPVMNERGLVGQVVLTSNNYSVVMSHQNTRFNVPAQIAELGRDGIVRWDGEQFDRLRMDYIVKTEPVEHGMLVTTSLVSANYPPGVPIGRVDSFFVARGQNHLVIYLDPSAPLSTVDLVYVVLSAPDEELLALEDVEIAQPRRR